ncbi:DUF2207 domain-containing protein [Rhizobium alvei]|uniref:DUF2207 domain-containing protein n=1 Tax=Rhizobium alvei TaxID=1132659 RepID=A0ABT8YG45_9HYPH|nr:DUF2207 domain-containing protein [Rhizobium alvei]MDO6962644.1 DUF2207 domain-containing protein [Rhizobium alvei]
MGKFLRFLPLLFLLLAALPARADERILSFHSVIELAKSGKMTVTETIKVNAEGSRIRRGIYRDFPLTFVGDDGATHRVDFSLLSVERDGAPDDYHTETIDGGIRIYIGKEDVFLEPGEHSFQITYETGRQIRYFPTHDELFWNVTGTRWEFAIMEASATVVLPDGVRPEATTFFTGPEGATGKKARVMEEDGEVFFATTFPLNVKEGLTIGVKFAKGAIDPPSEEDLARWQMSDSWNMLLAIGAFLVVLLYYVVNWFRVGRDPSKGIIVPRWDAPEGLSPALVNYVANKGFSNGGWTAFAASMVDLAVKGHIKLDDVGETVTLSRTPDEPKEALPPGEDTIYNYLRSTGASFAIAKANGSRVQKLGETFRSAIDKDHSGRYHRYNVGSIALGIILTVLAFVVTIVFGHQSEAMLGLTIVPSIVFLVVAIFSSVLGATVMSSTSAALRFFAGVMLAIFWLALLLVIGTSVVLAFEMIQQKSDLIALGFTGAMLIIAVFFTTIMGAATPLGRKLRDGIEGLRLYLTVAEKDRMNMAGAPTMSPQHYERLLPYAMALGVEKPWSDAFQSWLDKAGSAADYQPNWYHGAYDHDRFGERMGRFSSSLGSTISASLPPPPKSSSSGFSSGGSSGGGGGGGGGGW